MNEFGRGPLMAACRAVWITVLVLAGTACTAPEPRPGADARETVATVVDPDSGAVLGAASAADRRTRKQRMLVESGVGPMTESEVAAYLDRQVGALSAVLDGSTVVLSREEGRLRLVLPAVFATDSEGLPPGAVELLAGIGGVLESFDRTLVEVAGHAHRAGAASANQRLSESRALRVGRQLADAGVSRARLLVVGYGADRPAGDADVRDDRVVLVLVPVTQ